MPVLLGAIADDLTGATDLALTLRREGMRTVQLVGVPVDAALPDADALVVALKTRTVPASEAVARSRAAAARLTAAGARQIYFKFCSTFDSRDSGNIGPVIEALREQTGAGLTLATPAFPSTGRTVYLGHLFVGGALLSDSPMRDHPLTPMRDSNLVAVLQRQTRLRVGLLPYCVVRAGTRRIAAAIAEMDAAGVQVAIVDSLTEEDLRAAGAAAAGHALVAGASGMAIGLPENFRRAGLLPERAAPAGIAAPPGSAAILAGSCSVATREQLALALASEMPARRLDPLRLADGTETRETIAGWIAARERGRPLLVYASADEATVADVQSRLGRERSAALVEAALADAAEALVATGVTRLIVAGGETAGAVVRRLGVTTLEIGPEIDPGVPWTLSLGDRPLALALKSGNFGAPDFFLKAWSRLR